MPRPTKIILCVLGAALGLASGDARAGLIGSVTSNVAPQAGGLFLYTYTVNDLATSTSPISEFDLSLTTIPISGINTPVGVLISSINPQAGFLSLYTPSDPVVMFLSTDPSTDIQPGKSGVFSFLSTFAPESVMAQLATFDGIGSPQAIQTNGPAPAPEPSTLGTAGLGALASLGWLAYKRRRQGVA